jgi:hypothetical protein
VSWLTEPDDDWDSVDYEPDREPRSRLRLVALLLGGWLAVSVLVLLGLLLFGGHSGKPKAQPTGSAAGNTAASGQPSSSAPAEALPAGWTKQAGDDQTNCAAHAYGRVQAFFARTPCTSVHRLLATTSQHGRQVVIASNIVTFASSAQAQSYLVLVNSDGTGNISDLLREGVTYPGSPHKLPDAAFASRQLGDRVWVAEAGYVTGSSRATDPALKAIAAQGIAAS